MFSLEQKNAFITGAADGIGLAVARRFIEAGATVIIADIRDAQATADEIGAQYVPVDVSQENSVAAALRDGSQKHGKLDIVVNNAGVGDVGFTFEETSRELADKVTSINQFGVLWGLKHAPGFMKDGGSIINTASMAASVSMIATGVYSASKAAVVSMTRMAALELGRRGIRVNAVCPAYIATAMSSDDDSRRLAETFTALGRIGTTDEVVGLYHFLAADESRYYTGQAMELDGGWTAGPSAQLLRSVIGQDRFTG